MATRLCSGCNKPCEIRTVTPDPRVKGAKSVIGFMCPRCDYMPRRG